MKHKFLFILLILSFIMIPLNPNTFIYANTENIEYTSLISLSSLNLDSSNYILVDLNSGQVLDAKNADEPVYPASITKALTLITAIELLEGTDLKETYYTIPEEVFIGLDPEASVADLVQGESYTINDLLYSIILPSGADATRAISMYLTQDPEGLSTKMNELAKKLGMANSNFENTSGLDDPNHLTTVKDLSLVIQHGLQNETFRKIYTTPRYQYTNEQGTPYVLSNKALLYAVEEDFAYMSGAKSGYTDLSERSLSSIASKGDIDLLFVSTNATYDYDINYSVLDAIKVYNYVFDNYTYQIVPPLEEKIDTVNITQGSYNVDIILDKEIEVLLPNEATLDQLTYTFIPSQEEFIAPVEKDTLLGSLQIFYEDELIYAEDIKTQDIIEIHWFYIFLEYVIEIGKWIVLALVIALTLLMGYKYNYKRKRKKSRTMAARR